MKRLDIYLTEKYPTQNRSRWAKHIDADLVLVNGKVATKHLLVSDEDTIEIKEAKKVEIKKIHVPIIAQTDDYIVINKPVGIAAHKTSEHEQAYSVADFALEIDPKIAEVGDNTTLRPGIVHRLDKDVTGVMIIARTQKMFEFLKSQFQERTIQKEYLGIASEHASANTYEAKFPIVRTSRTGKMAAIQVGEDHGKEALTVVEVLDNKPHAALLACFPKTGRTHQIRVHCKALNLPLYGDKLYGTDLSANRVMLHARRLTIPFADGEKTFEAPIPEDMQQLIKKLQFSYDY